MLRYKTITLLLLCFSIFTVLLQRTWLTLRHNSTPISRLNNVNDDSVDRLSVQNTQRKDLHDRIEILNTSEDVDNSMNSLGLQKTQRSDIRDARSETMNSYGDLNDNVNIDVHYQIQRTDIRDAGSETKDIYGDLNDNVDIDVHKQTQRTNISDGSETMDIYADLNDNVNIDLHQQTQRAHIPDGSETMDIYADLNDNVNIDVHQQRQRAQIPDGSETMDIYGDLNDNVNIDLHQQSQRAHIPEESETMDIYADLNDNVNIDVDQQTQHAHIPEESETMNIYADLNDNVNITVHQTAQSINFQDGNGTIDGYKLTDINSNMNINESNLKLIDPECKLCRTTKPVFIDEHKPFVALASFPGSGNSWTRELLEYITGVYTGSVYVDTKGNFPGSKRCPLRGGVYIVKTHKPGNGTGHWDCNKIEHRAKIDYQKAMFILRNPYDAILSSFNLIHGGKVDFASQQAFENMWRKFVQKRARMWQTMTQYWITTFERTLHVIVYEQLKKETPNELLKIGKFLNLNTTHTDAYCAKLCLKQKYHREKPPEWMNTSFLYAKELRNVVNDAINDVIHAVDNKDDILQALKSYVKGTGV